MKQFIETLLRLDADGNMADMEAFVSNKNLNPAWLSWVVLELLSQRQLRLAVVLARTISAMGYTDMIASLARTLVGMLANDPREEQAGLEALRIKADLLSDEQRTIKLGYILTTANLILRGNASHRDASDYSDLERKQILCIYKMNHAFSPRLRTMFDQDAIAPSVSLEKMRQGAQNHLFSYLLPPTARRQQRRVVVSMRKYSLFGGRVSFKRRLSDFGPRIDSAMQTYGWQVESMDCRASSFAELDEDCHNVVEACRQHKAEILVFDLNVYGGTQACILMLAQLRQENPSIKVIACPIDSKDIFKEIIAVAPHIDLLWTREGPSLSIWSHPDIANKVLHVPFPNAGHAKTPDLALAPKMFFSGYAQVGTIRSFWLALSESRGLPIQTRFTTPVLDDGLPPLESFASYMQGLHDATCVLNFSMTSFLPPHYYVNWRTFEGMLSGALMVQEFSPEAHYYFVPGEHYLEFSSLAELTSIAQFIVENRDEAEEVRSRGNAFAREHYSDEKLIGYLDGRLNGLDHRFGHQ